MTKDELIKQQKAERAALSSSIITSGAQKKIIIAGAGTGKTYTFKQIVDQNPAGDNLAMTFIKMLRDDIMSSLGEHASVKTFHEFCKGLLHKIYGDVYLYPKLNQLIVTDSAKKPVDYDNLFQLLEEGNDDLKYYLARGNYYKTVSFDDSVYRVYIELKKKPDIFSPVDHILIDEFQDFNPLEVAFIKEIQEHGRILIVGDDDQAVYDSRGSSPQYLRDLYNSGEYQLFELPFCTRCTEAVVNSINSLIDTAVTFGNLSGRIPKRYECFIESKDADNQRFPKVVAAHLSSAKILTKFILNEASKIPIDIIEESWAEGKEYPTILIVGSRQYLNVVNKDLKKNSIPNVEYKQSVTSDILISEAYEFLLKDIKANIGWRILIELLYKKKEVLDIVSKTYDDTPLIELLPEDFVDLHTGIVSYIRKFNEDAQNNTNLLLSLHSLLEDKYVDDIEKAFLKKVEKPEPDKLKPSILLTSFVGCKGLSAGYVFIIGANNGVIPLDTASVRDIELCQFIVAMTRTRKKCYILSEDYFMSPIGKDGKWLSKQHRSEFIDYMDQIYVQSLGSLKSGDIK